jgi:chloramphenicol 3-O phosphotransferase
MVDVRIGRVILINGTSSSGKTTLINALRTVLDELWLNVGIDAFAHALPGRVGDQPTWPLLFPYVRPDGRSDGPFTIETTALGTRLITGMHETVATLARAGLNVIVDHVILEETWVDEIDRVWHGLDVLAVGVRCPLEVVVERERSRGDRTIGQAEAQFAVVHRWMVYDLEVDTSVLTPTLAACQIRDALGTGG